LIDNDVVVNEISKELEGIGTNNEAEYFALIERLQHAINLGWKDVCIQGDSRLVIDQVAGSWSINADNLKKLNAEAKELIKRFTSVKLEWIERERNSKSLS
jgi:ribonuclease HI